jgi:hypothetical protein
MKETTEKRYIFPFTKDVLNLDATTGHMTANSNYKSPEGFSGGGLWASRNLDTIDGLMHPGNMFRLFGIDYAWCEGKQEAYCVPIRYWVKLIYDEYPDLQDMIRARFPNIADVSL